MFLKNSRSSVGVGAGVCACKATVVASINTMMPKRHSDFLLLRILLPLEEHFAKSPNYGLTRSLPLPVLTRSKCEYYFPITSTAKEPGLMLRCGLPPAVVAGVSIYSAALRKIFFVFGSKAMVRALGCVLTAPASS